MERVPILKIGQTLFVSIQIDLQDESVVRLQEDLADELAATGARGVILDITADVPHVFQSFAGVLDEADEALDRAALFLTQHIRRLAPAEAGRAGRVSCAV